MRGFFLGKPWHWALLAIIVTVLTLVGRAHMQTNAFNLFTIILLAVALVTVGLLVETQRPGDRVTREPFEEE